MHVIPFPLGPALVPNLVADGCLNLTNFLHSGRILIFLEVVTQLRLGALQLLDCHMAIFGSHGWADDELCVLSTQAGLGADTEEDSLLAAVSDPARLNLEPDVSQPLFYHGKLVSDGKKYFKGFTGLEKNL